MNESHPITLEGRFLTTPEEAHPYLRRTLSLPDYYGDNLDALYDILTEGAFALTLEGASLLSSGWGRRLLDTLLDAAEENPALALSLKS